MTPEVYATRKVWTSNDLAEAYLFGLGFHHVHNIWIKPYEDLMAGVYIENKTQFVTYEWSI